MNAYDSYMEKLKSGYVCIHNDELEPLFTEDEKSIPVSRKEYRFLLMEYTRLMMELAEMKKTAEGYKRELYEAFTTWNEFEPMSYEQSARFDQLKEEYKPKTEDEAEGSLEE